jgi:hypothetical protein
MANFVFNLAKGRIVELYSRVKNNDPAPSALVLIPLETSGLEAQSVLEDADSVAAVIAGTTNKQTTMGEKVLTDAELAALPAPDDANNRYDLSLPSVTWVAAAGNPISQILVAYRPNTAAASDSTDIPLTVFDRVETPSGSSDIVLSAGVFFRAS